VPAITIFDSKEEIPEDLRETAQEVEGKFHVDANALTANYKKILGEKKQRDADLRRLTTEAEKYKDLDPERAREALKAIADAEAEKLKTQGDWDAREAALKTGFATEKQTFETQLSERDKALDKLVIFNELARVAALPDIKGVAALLEPHIAPFIRRKGTVDYEILDASGAVRYGTDGQPLRMEAYLKELREDAILSRLFDATGASGSGASTTTGGAGGAVKIDKTLKRSKMSDKEKADFVRDHGYAKFKELPE
jgi:hypothetical protein